MGNPTIKLNSVLLVDDDEATNFLNQMLLKKVSSIASIAVANNGQEAMEYLTNTENPPDLIFLDINMPVMDGWDFLNAYENLDPTKRGKIILMMLTTSLNPDDKYKAEDIKIVDGFLSKPLSKDTIDGILTKYF